MRLFQCVSMSIYYGHKQVWRQERKNNWKKGHRIFFSCDLRKFRETADVTKYPLYIINLSFDVCSLLKQAFSRNYKVHPYRSVI